jgi:alpha-L-fucosidase
LLHEMIDVVSKNCNFLLNIPPRGDGSFDKGTLEILSEFGRWFDVNGEAIYKTRPWTIFGEKNIRYTVKNNVLYAIMLEKDDNPVGLLSLSEWPEDAVKNVELLGSGSVFWEWTTTGLKISLPANYKDDLAYVFKITCTKSL